MNQKSRIDLLNKHLNRWMELPKISRTVVAGEIVEACIRLDLLDVLAKEGISFARTVDPYNDMRINQQKIFRWLGASSDHHVQPERLIFVEQAIVAAMPEKIRLEYLNEIYLNCGAVITAPQQTNHSGLTILDAIALFAKEGGEAQSVVIHLLNSSDPEAKKHALRELEEAAIAISHAISAVKSTDTPTRLN